MTQVVDSYKKGGPYTKKEKIDRRDEVFKLHFEQGYSAVKIAKTMNVNRNTINEDIQFWYLDLSKEMKNIVPSSWLMKQIHRLESQRDRLYEELEKLEKPLEKLAFEKQIFEIENKITQIILKISLDKNSTFSFKKEIDEIAEEEVKQLVRELISIYPIHNYSGTFSSGAILSHIIKVKKCDHAYAEKILNKMIDLGLNLYRKENQFWFESKYSYNLLTFAIIRNYISKTEISKRQEKRREQELKEKQAAKELDKKLENLENDFIKKHGSEKYKWPRDVYKEFKRIYNSYEEEFDSI